MRTADDLRAALFSMIDDLTDRDKEPDLPRAKAVADVAQVIINVGKLEVEYAKAVKRPIRSGFLTAIDVEDEPLVPELEDQSKEVKTTPETEAAELIHDMPKDLYLRGYTVKGITRHIMDK